MAAAAPKNSRPPALGEPGVRALSRHPNCGRTRRAPLAAAAAAREAPSPELTGAGGRSPESGSKSASRVTGSAGGDGKTQGKTEG